MTQTKFFDEPIAVTASVDQTGQTTPVSLTWQAKDYSITVVGRQWDAADGRHVLVESATGDRFEIQLSREDLLWRLKRSWSEEMAA
jgi:hypothetical protein